MQRLQHSHNGATFSQTLLAAKLALLVGYFVLGGCTPAAHASATKVGMVVRGLGDHSFSDSANAGLQAADERLGVAVTVLQTHDISVYEPDLIALTSASSAQTFAIGYNMRADLTDVAARFRRTISR